MNIEQLCDYIPFKPVKQTVYGWVNKQKIPSYKKDKGIYFLKSEIDSWLLEGGVKTKKEGQFKIQLQNDTFLKNNKKL